MNAGRTPDFVIAGTQKAGTTWLEHHLAGHPGVFTPRRQIHFFDRHFDRGHAWYASWFRGAEPGKICGEKTTEYFDIPTAEDFARRVAGAYPELKVIVVLREPVGRALSALQHMVNAGLERLRPDLERLLFEDMSRPPECSFRYIERGFYARQLDALTRHIPPERLLVLIFEEDIVASPARGLDRACRFLEIEPVEPADLGLPINKVRLSAAGAALAYRLHHVPYARSVVRRLDKLLGLPQWKPRFRAETVERLREIYREPNEALFERLGRRIPSWTQPAEHGA